MTDQLKEAQLGIEAEQFKSTDLGRYLLARAQDDIVVAFKEWQDADPEDAKAIRAIQNKAQVAESFLNWIDEAIFNGKYAEDEIRSNDV